MSTHTDRFDDSAQEDSIELMEFEGDIDPKFDIPNQGEILIISNDQSYLTHGVHKFPAKFFPELPRYLIRKYSRFGDTVLDPMCGSGTVVLESMLNNRIGVGIDIDPIARLITKVKTTPIAPKTLTLAARDLIAQINTLDNSSDYHPQTPEFHYRDTFICRTRVSNHQ
jgi:hypothetical protein